MRIERVWVLRGPNVWARCPVFEVEVDLQDRGDAATADVAGLADRLLSYLPTLAGRRATDGALDTFRHQVQRQTSLAHVLRHVALELQCLAGSDVRFGLVRATPRAACYRVVVEFEEEDLARPCLDAALALCQAAADGLPYDTDAKLRELRELAFDVRLGPSTGAIVRAALKRHIPVRRLNSGSLVQLGWGVRQRRIRTAETDQTGAIAEAIAQDKQLTRQLLRAVGVPVPEGRPVASAEEAWEAAQDLEPPVVVKPQFGNHGRGVATNLTTREQVLQAYAAAREEDDYVVVERFHPGADHRLLVIGDKLVAAARREPAHVVGDGHSSVAQLVEEVNRDPRRSDGHATPLSWIKLDAVGLAVLAEQGYTPESVPPSGARVLIRRNGNLSTGGTAVDVTDQVHPEVAAHAVDAAKAVGLDVAGVDFVIEDVGAPPGPQRAAVVEVNASPGLRMHLEPSEGKARPVGEAIVSFLFPEGQNGRVPVVAVTGVNGKTTTVRLVAHVLKGTGRTVGMTCTDGLYVDGRRIDARDCSGPRSARAVLLHPRVDAAVLETARGGILREGLGFDHCDVGVVTNIGHGDHLSLRGVETLDDLARVKRVVVEAVAPSGAAVLNADDPLVAAMAPACRGSVLFFTRRPAGAVAAAHRGRGGRVAFARDGGLFLAEGAREDLLMPLSQVPLTLQGKVGFQVENVLAAAAACEALGLPRADVRAGLASFTGDAAQAPGRFNVFCAGEATVVVDYAHNPSALAALAESLDAFPHARRTLVFSGCNRRDEDLLHMGRVVASGFDQVILHPDRGNSDRADGALNALLRRGMEGGPRTRQVIEAPDERSAVELGLQSLRPGDLLVVGAESVEETLALVQPFVTHTGDRGTREACRGVNAQA